MFTIRTTECPHYWDPAVLYSSEFIIGICGWDLETLLVSCVFNIPPKLHICKIIKKRIFLRDPEHLGAKEKVNQLLDFS